ncbi:right-handed parallel beta-helix repeat-containing protein [Magnetospirillum sulfuroxidans]|uniref:Right-handed parallel beta-helix repeat-containing protein n=1 Tax=Magnetospirillum sulfuroxidans TaxID=611300 RepID=A0ABS5ICW7_9PROT|nr:right-handed parallel beta-helix repeat-containing protein [Magnetospirillum sulfuroxidans]
MTARQALCLAATALSSLPLSPVRAEQPKWGASVDSGIKASENRRIGELDLFLPVAQDDRNLLFLDLRTNFDNLSQREGNFGLGYRAMQDDGWNLGIYGFFDRRRSSENHYFSQITTGIEALGPDFDARINAYIPIGNKSHEVENSTQVDLSGGTIQILSGMERVYHGGDAELGWRVPIFAADRNAEMRIYGGGYWFDAESSESVAGPRARLEFRLYDPIEALPGSRVTFSGELQRDDARGTQHFFGLKLRIPLQAETTARRLSPQERRMTDPLVRDVDIVTQSATISEAATLGGQTLSGVTTITDGATAQAAINAAGAGKLIVLNGTTTVSSQLTLGQGQTLSSGGSVITLTGSSSGKSVSFSVPGSSGTLTGSLAGTSVLALSSNSTLSGLIVENTNTADDSNAVSAVGISGASIIGATLTSAKGAALRIENSSSMTVNKNTLRASGLSSSALSVDNADDSTFSNNTISATGWHGTAFSLLNSSGLNVTGNTVSASGAGATALRMDQSAGTVSGNTISTTGDGDGTTNAYALWITQGGGSTVSNNTVSGSGQYGTALYVDNSAAITVSGNTLTASGYAGRGIQLYNSAGSTIANNTVTTNDTTTGTGFYTSATGLFMENSANTKITDNTIVTKGEAAGMNLRSSNNLTVSGNKITTIANQAIGMVLTGSADGTITGNTISTTGTSSHGIQLFLNANNALVENNTVTVSGSSANLVYVSNGNDIRIINNKLTGAGNSGVTSTGSISNLTVSGNTP